MSWINQKERNSLQYYDYFNPNGTQWDVRSLVGRGQMEVMPNGRPIAKPGMKKNIFASQLIKNPKPEGMMQ